MMSPEALNAKLDDMLKDTKAGHLKWRLEIETSEYEDRGKGRQKGMDHGRMLRCLFLQLPGRGFCYDHL